MLDKDGKLRKKFSVLCNIMHHTQDKRPCLTTSRRELEIWCIKFEEVCGVWKIMWSNAVLCFMPLLNPP